MGRCRKGPSCSAGRAFAGLPPEVHRAARMAATEGLQLTSINRWLRETYGVDVHDATLTRHLRYRCACR
jgi:hypothetical protein